jgi:uncharacterized protein (DUF2336 family)
MVEYQEFVSLSRSSDSEVRGQAAHLCAIAYLEHNGPADEHAALYAAVIGFLDDPSVKVRAALAYGLLHSAEAPRPVMLSLMRDSAIIARAVVQYSPVLLDTDLVGQLKTYDTPMLLAVAQRTHVSARLAAALIGIGDDRLTRRLIERRDVQLDARLLSQLAELHGDRAEMRGALLSRSDLPADARLLLVLTAPKAIQEARIVHGALAPERLARLLRDTVDTALSAIGEQESVKASPTYVSGLVAAEQINTRLLLHSVIHGHVLFFADCLAVLSQAPRDKVFSLLESGSRASLNALLVRCGIGEGIRSLLARLVLRARASDLVDDASARHFVVTALTEELIAEHDGVIPIELQEAFSYLSEQNVLLARKAARGVMAAFAGDTTSSMTTSLDYRGELLTLPAA